MGNGQAVGFGQVKLLVLFKFARVNVPIEVGCRVGMTQTKTPTRYGCLDVGCTVKGQGGINGRTGELDIQTFILTNRT